MAVRTRENLGAGALRDRIGGAWSADTSVDPEGWSDRNPAWGQCAVTALIVQDLAGGVLLHARVSGTSHYWNRLPSGEELDLTYQQFPDGWRIEIPPEVRTREYMLAFPDTARRYELLRERLEPR